MLGAARSHTGGERSEPTCVHAESCFQDRFDVAGRLHHLLHRVTAIDDRTEFACLDKFLQALHVVFSVPGWDCKLHLLVAKAGDPRRKKQVLESVSCELSTTRLK
jgi:hypothetical protein